MGKNLISIFIALILPFFLLVTVWQSNRYSVVQKEIIKLQNKQQEIVSANSRLISEITILSTPEVIEKKAVEQLTMRKALPSEIIRIELKKGDLGG